MKCFGKLKRTSMGIIAIVGLLTIAPDAKGQVQNTLYQTLATNSVVTGTVILGPVRNIGQSFHQVMVVFSGSGCVQSNSDLNVSIWGSSVNAFSVTNAENFGYPVDVPQGNFTLPNVGLSLLYQGAGAYPFVYVRITSTVLAGCSYSVQYSGSIQSIQPQPQLSILRTLNQFQTVSSTFMMGTSSLGAAIAGNLGTQAIYGLSAGSSAATVFTITCTSTGATFVFNIGTSETVVYPFTGKTYFTCPAASGITATVSAAATVNATINIYNQRQF